MAPRDESGPSHVPLSGCPVDVSAPEEVCEAAAEQQHAAEGDDAINTGAQTHEELHNRHGSVLGSRLPLIERGQADGAFRTDVPAAWHLSMTMALIHAGSAELRAGRVPADSAEMALVATVLGAVTGTRLPGNAAG